MKKKIVLISIMVMLSGLAFSQNKYNYYTEGNIKSAFYTQRFNEGVKDYEKAIEKNIALDSESVSLALFCFVNKDDGYVLPKGVKTIGTKSDAEIKLFLRLADDLIKKDLRFTCLRKRIYQKLCNCYNGTNDSMFKYFLPFLNADEKVCNECCVVKSKPGSSSGGISEIDLINSKISGQNFNPLYGKNESLKISGAVPHYSIDSFVNEAAIWGNGIDTGIIAHSKIYITVKKDGSVSYGSFIGTTMLTTNQKIINSKYRNAFSLTAKLKEIFAQMPKWETTMAGGSVSGTYTLTLWAK